MKLQVLLHCLGNTEHHLDRGRSWERNCWRSCFQSKGNCHLPSLYCKKRRSIGCCSLLDRSLLYMTLQYMHWMSYHRNQNLMESCMSEHSIGYYLLRGSNLGRLFPHKRMSRCRFRCQTEVFSKRTEMAQRLIERPFPLTGVEHVVPRGSKLNSQLAAKAALPRIAARSLTERIPHIHRELNDKGKCKTSWLS